MHAGTLAQPAQAALAILGKTEILKDAYLAGGSALALQLGHRKSYDFDFYTPKNVFAEDVARELAKAGHFQTTILSPPHTLLGEFNGVKFSLFRYNYPILIPFTQFLGVKIASVEDIAAMKLTAICSRATKRDYVDLYVLAQSHPFDAMFSWYEKKFGPLGNNQYVIVRALQYFEDAQDDKMPEMFIPLSWQEVKKFLSARSRRLAEAMLA